MVFVPHIKYFPPIFFVVMWFSGPGFNLFLREFNVKLGPFLIDKYTAPGVSWDLIYKTYYSELFWLSS